MDDDLEFDKVLGQFQLALNGVMKPLRMYGQAHYVDSASKEVLSLALQLHHRLSGIDEPFIVNYEKLHY